ncbi:TPA: DUF2304 domain-containing protein [Patescibacteria group bacterium]|nr:MAG: hypothetical protein UX54_C0007G0007 [Parcubacteria group bacterium GW2011_GWA2_46_39]HBV33711.1 DUF2304 domain-containing protein [Patescibacteria group bacterium]HCU48145.1 DUF2304 domain-containing protein [Patescibacteria group bacterium]
MSVIQIVILLFVLYVWLRLYLKFKKGELLLREFVEWFALWLLVALVTILPDAASYVANLLGVGRGADLVVYLALLLIFYLLFKIFLRLEKSEQQFTKVVREMALRDKEKGDK